MSEIVTKITGISVLEYLRKNLFDELGFGTNYWFAGPGNTVAGGGGLHISIDDFAKLGLLYLNKGVYEGKRYLSKEWISMATSVQIETAPSYPSAKVENCQGYGFKFWRCSHNGFRASGMWAQMCLVLPDQNMVLAIQSSGNGSEATLQQVWKHLLPGVKHYSLSYQEGLTQKLETCLAGQHIPCAEGSRASRLEALVPKIYAFKRNPYGFKGIGFIFGEESVQVDFDHEWGIYSARAGRGEFRRDDVSTLAGLTHMERDLHMPEEPRGYVPPKIYTRAVWIDESQLLITQRLLDAASQIEWRFRFEGSCLLAVHSSKNVYGSFKDVVLAAPYGFN